MSGAVLKRYREATSWLADQVEPVIVNGKLDFPESTAADAFAIWSEGCDYEEVESEKKNKGYYVITEQAGLLIARGVDDDPNKFDAAAKICAANVLFNEPLPAALRLFASQVLSGEVTRPKQNHRPRKRNWFELSYLYNLSIECSVRFNLFLTRNDEGSNKYSSCDALAEALEVCGRKTKYSEIKNLHVHPDFAVFREEQKQAQRAYKRKESMKKIVRALLNRLPAEAVTADAMMRLASFGGLGGLGGFSAFTPLAYDEPASGLNALRAAGYVPDGSARSEETPKMGDILGFADSPRKSE